MNLRRSLQVGAHEDASGEQVKLVPPPTHEMGARDASPSLPPERRRGSAVQRAATHGWCGPR
eukprot:811719-Pyramimonas_sp.AAC.1